MTQYRRELYQFHLGEMRNEMYTNKTYFVSINFSSVL